MNMLIVKLFLTFTVLLISPSFSEENSNQPSINQDYQEYDFAQGLAAAQSGNFQVALKAWKPLAENNDAKAQYYLSLLYHYGDGVTKDQSISNYWLERAADGDFVNAQNRLGEYFYEGKMKPLDPEKAVRLFTKAARSGFVKSQFWLAHALDNGRGIREDKEKAMEWYEKAAEQGNLRAAHNLAVIKHTGPEDLRNYKDALKWYQFAAQGGISRSQYNIGMMYYHGEGVSQNYSEAFNWFDLAALKSMPEAEAMLGVMYSEGQSVETDYSKALDWFERSAAAELALAQHNIGVIYLFGRGVSVDYQEAAKWFILAAEQGYEDSQRNLDIMLENGQIVDQEPTKKAINLTKGKEAGEISEEIILDFEASYEAKDYPRAFTGAQLLAVEGDPTAQFYLGMMFQMGQGTIQMATLAHMWFNIAAMGGIDEAYVKRKELAADMTPAAQEEAQKMALLCIQSQFTECGLMTKSSISQNEAQGSTFDPDILKLNFIEQSSLKRKQLQYALKELGFYASSIDGLWGGKTSLAFTNYQKAMGVRSDNPSDLFEAVLSEVKVPSLFTNNVATKNSAKTIPSGNTDRLSDSIDRMTKQLEYQQGMRQIDNAQRILQSVMPRTSPIINCNTFGNLTTCY